MNPFIIMTLALGVCLIISFVVLVVFTIQNSNDTFYNYLKRNGRIE